MAQDVSGQASPQKLAVNEAVIRGRVVGKPRRYTTRDGEVFTATLVRVPAVDEFSSAATVEVNSAGRDGIGADGDIWQGRVRISGSARSFKYTDREGQEQRGVDCTIRLEVA